RQTIAPALDTATLTPGPWLFDGANVVGPGSQVGRNFTAETVVASLPDDATSRTFADGEWIATMRTLAPAMGAALTAVLTRHHADADGDCPGCGVDAYGDPVPWPCATVKDVETALASRSS